MKEKRVLLVSYANVVNVRIVCRNYPEYLSMLNGLKLNSYSFEFCKRCIWNTYTIRFKNNKKNKRGQFDSDILLHNKSSYNDKDNIVMGKYYDCRRSRIIYDFRYEAEIKYDSILKRITIYTKKDNFVDIVVDLLREQFVQKSVEKNNYYFLKAAAFTYNPNNDVCAIVGNSGTGKTTILLNFLLRKNNTNYLTNSAAYITLRRNKVSIISWRPHMRIRRGTAIQINSIGNYWELNAKEKVDFQEDFIKLDTYEKIGELFEISTVKQGTLSKIILLDTNINKENVVEIEQVKESTRVVEIIRTNLRVGIDPAHPDCWNLCNSNNKNLPNLDKIVNDLLLKCDVYILKINYERIEEIGEHVEEILDRILQ